MVGQYEKGMNWEKQEEQIKRIRQKMDKVANYVAAGITIGICLWLLSIIFISFMSTQTIAESDVLRTYYMTSYPIMEHAYYQFWICVYKIAIPVKKAWLVLMY